MGRRASTADKGHGRRGKRALRTTTILTPHQKWPGLAQGFELTRARTAKGRTSVGVVYGITSLRPEQADAARPLGLVRDHRRIESSLHYVRDVTPGEGACRVRQGGAPPVLSTRPQLMARSVGNALRGVPSHRNATEGVPYSAPTF